MMSVVWQLVVGSGGRSSICYWEAELYSVVLVPPHTQDLRSSRHTTMREMTWLVVVVFCLSQQVLGLTLTQLKVPPFGLGGQSARLVCEYDSQGEQVYSVKWYKGGLEIFRFLPSSAPPLSVFPRPGVNILQSQSNATVLQLTNLTVATTGRYRCEVSTEAPVFRTESKYGDLLVIVLPSAPPQISGENRTSLAQLAPGDLLLLSCRSDQSKPAADLGWTINGHKVTSSHPQEGRPVMMI